MNTILAVLVLTLIVGAPTFSALWFMRGQKTPETIHQSVIVPYGQAQSEAFQTELVKNAGVEFPILTSVESTPPIVLSAISLIFDTFFINERSRKVYCTSIRIGICIQNPNHQSAVLYRHPNSSRFTRKGPFVFTNKRDWESLSPAQLQAIQEFIEVHNCLRYRSVEGAHDILVPPTFKEAMQQQGRNMFLSTEFFSPQPNSQLLEEKILALQNLAMQLETPQP